MKNKDEFINGKKLDTGDTLTVAKSKDGKACCINEYHFKELSTNLLLRAGNMIARARREKGLTQKDLANKMGVNQAWISALESGRVNISIKVLDKIAKALDTTLLSPRFNSIIKDECLLDKQLAEFDTKKLSTPQDL
jgi:ribosome-binding protein aMBF1 (putative translation factor)